MARAETHALPIQWDKFEYWTLRRSDSLDICGVTIVAKDDLHFLGIC